MSVTVNVHPNLRHITDNIDLVEVKGRTVGECLEYLVKQYPELKKMLFDKNNTLLAHVDIYINEESAYPEELAKPVKDGDTIQIVMMLAGG
ncbi:MAG: MoaD/ThiS family protein [Chloroflexi bacterium]|nr:MoaD/ThiS family protein [Chloroflexota bacterium]